MSQVPSALIFDLDGTLLDSKTVILECFGQAVESVYPGLRLDHESVRLGPPLRRMFQISFPKATDSDVNKMLQTFRHHYDREGPIRTRAYDGALDVLTHCQVRRLALHVATNKPLHISTAILSHLKLDHYFRSIVALDSMQPPFSGKKEVVRHLLQSSQLKPAETWYVGDSPDDAAAAAECALPFIWAAYGYGRLEPEDEGSVFRTITKLTELKELLP